MNLSKYTDYSFRALIYLGINRDKLCKVENMSNDLKISNHHIKKIVFNLAKEGYISSSKGRSGGIKLAKNPTDIKLDEVLLFCENLYKMLQCEEDRKYCTYNIEKCLIKNIVDEAREKFIEEFKKYTLNDLLNSFIV